MISINDKGKGAVKDKVDLRKYNFDYIFGASSVPAEFDISDKVQWDKDQDGSGSCGGQAFSYYMEVLSLIRDGKYTKLSAKDLYAPVHLSPMGSRASDLLNRLANSGIAEEADVPSYDNGNPPKEPFMEDASYIRDNDKAMQYWIDKSYLTYSSTDPEQVKQAIYKGNGAVIALLGNDPCWTTANGEIEVPARGTTTWGHFIFLTGYQYRHGELYFKFKNSWGKDWGDNGFGYLPARYLKAGLGYNEWVIVELPRDKYSTMTKTIFILRNLIALLKQLMGIK